VKKQALKALIVLALFIFSFTSFSLELEMLTVDGTESFFAIQGQEVFFRVSTTTYEYVGFDMISDENGNGEIDPEDLPFIPMESWIRDYTPFREPDDSPFSDTNSVVSVIDVPLSLCPVPGNYIFRFTADEEEIIVPFEYIEPLDLLYSVSGMLVFEGICPPDPVYSGHPVLITDGIHSVMMFDITDEEGSFHINWVFDAGYVMILAFVDDGEPVTQTMEITGHHSAVIIEITEPAGMWDLNLVVDGEPRSTIVQGETYSISYSCDPGSFYMFYFLEDLDGSGTWTDGDNIALSGLYLLDNDPDPDSPVYDSDPEEGRVEAIMGFHLWEGDWILLAGLPEAMPTETLSISVISPPIVEHHVSGRFILEGIDAPNPVLDGILGFAGTIDPMILMMFITNEYGEFSFNWTGEPGTLYLQTIGDMDYLEPLGFEAEDFVALFAVSGWVDDLEIFVPRRHEPYPTDSIYLNVITDPDNPPPVPHRDLYITYLDLKEQSKVTGSIILNGTASKNTCARPRFCFFNRVADDYHFYLHNFIAIWIPSMSARTYSRYGKHIYQSDIQPFLFYPCRYAGGILWR
jgi:hypothetical protein